MVKREDIKPGAVIKVVKEMPGTGRPGPSFSGKLGKHERLDVLGKPGSRGGMNIVKVKRHKTGEEFEALYAWVTGFCRIDTKAPERDLEVVHDDKDEPPNTGGD